MRTFLVVNPKSASGETGRRWPEIHAEVLRIVGEADHAFTERPMHAADLTASALKQGYRRIVAIGGDGTVNEVVNGFFRHPGGVPPDARLALIPRGTGGDFRRTFGLGTGVREACTRLSDAREGESVRPLDVGRVRYTTPEGGSAERYFVNVASFGVSGRVDRAVNASSKALGGKVSFFLASVKTLIGWHDQHVRIRADGGPEEALSITTLAVANGQYFGGGMRVAPQADPSDGLLDVTVWSGYGLADFALKSRSVYDGSHVRWKGTRVFRCRTLEASSDEEVLLDVDGEQPGRLPARFEVLPGALRLQA
jgi:YegS/Rv2252/BmrU family lipid kinase